MISMINPCARKRRVPIFKRQLHPLRLHHVEVFPLLCQGQWQEIALLLVSCAG